MRKHSPPFAGARRSSGWPAGAAQGPAHGRALPPGPWRPAWNLHEATRLALRNRLLATDAERFRLLSRRAAAANGTADPDAPDFVLTCEHLFHQLAGQTDPGDTAMACVARDWRNGFRFEPLQSLTRLLEELLAARPAPPLLPRGQGWAYQAIANALENHQPSPVTQALVQKAEANFQPLAASEPANAGWQRDLWVSYWKLADHCEKSNHPVEAKAWWKKALNTLAGMNQRGLHVSPQDEGFLERLRAKAAGK